MRLIIANIFLLSSIFLFAQEENIEQSKISFKIKNIGRYAKGTFSESSITGYFNVSNLENSFLNASIKVKSIDTGIKKRDKHLLEDDYFDVATYPVIVFSSTKIEKKSDVNYILHGKLTIKKISKTVQLPLVIADKDNHITVVSNFTISRKEYGVGGRSWVLSDKVKAKVQFTVKKG